MKKRNPDIDMQLSNQITWMFYQCGVFNTFAEYLIFKSKLFGWWLNEGKDNGNN